MKEHACLRLLRTAQRTLAREDGFTIVETIMAGVILVVLSTAIAGVLTSSISAHTVARERTNAEQCANSVVEQIRRKDYDQVGIVSGNPPGTVAASSACVAGPGMTAAVTISYEDDPTPTSYATGANYKKVTVTVTRDRDGKQLATVVTYVAPSARAPYGGINNAIINATVFDLGTNLAYTGGATVALSNGPSPNRNDTTDISGSVSFAALTPNPTSGPTSYYDLTVTAATGYETLASDLPPGTATPPATASHIQLAPSQTSATTIQIYKPATINVVLLDGGGSPYTGGAALTIASSFTGATTTDSVASGASSKTITLLGGKKIIPGATYTVEGRTASGLCAMPASSPVPTSGYPGNTTGTFTLQFTACPAGNIAVNVKQLGINIAGATVNITGGPNNMSITSPPLTDVSGNASFSVPAGTGYTVSATKTQTAPSASADVTVGATTNVALVLAAPPTGTLVVNVTQFAAAVSGATVTVSGGPWSISQSLTTPGSGQVTFSAVPAGTGYTVTATKGSDTANTTTTLTTGSTTVNLALPNPPSGTVQATVQWIGANVTGATVYLTGGPYSINVSVGTMAPGVVTFTGVPAGSGYTLYATKNGQQSPNYSPVVAASTTTPVTVVMPTATLTVTATWATLPAGGATVSVTGGPDGGSYPGTTDPITGIATITVPTTTSNNYTVTIAKNTGSGLSTVTTVPVGGQSTAVAILPTKTVTVTVQQSGAAYKNKSVVISVTGGPNGVAGAAPAYTKSAKTTNATPATVTVVVPAAAGYTYTVKASVGPTCATGAARTTAVPATTMSSAAATTTVTVNMTDALTCPYTP